MLNLNLYEVSYLYLNDSDYYHKCTKFQLYSLIEYYNSFNYKEYKQLAKLCELIYHENNFNFYN